MKIRTNFVSNSSSSSFIVNRRHEYNKDRPLLLSSEQEQLLKDNGFRLGICYFPNQIANDEVFELPLSADELAIANWCKSVTCNQDDEIGFLLRHRISFMADVHYEHSSMLYDGTSDVLLIAENFGKQMQMAGEGKINFDVGANRAPITRTTGKQYLELRHL
jgi:hypothetical protein